MPECAGVHEERWEGLHHRGLGWAVLVYVGLSHGRHIVMQFRWHRMNRFQPRRACWRLCLIRAHRGPRNGKSHVQVSCDAYRSVVRGDKRFIDYFANATPVSELGKMNIGSRPAKRKVSHRCQPGSWIRCFGCRSLLSLRVSCARLGAAVMRWG